MRWWLQRLQGVGRRVLEGEAGSLGSATLLCELGPDPSPLNLVGFETDDRAIETVVKVTSGSVTVVCKGYGSGQTSRAWPATFRTRSIGRGYWPGSSLKPQMKGFYSLLPTQPCTCALWLRWPEQRAGAGDGSELSLRCPDGAPSMAPHRAQLLFSRLLRHR